MREEWVTLSGKKTRMIFCNTAVVGTGASGYNAADQLWKLGQHDIVLLTENRVAGTSRNTGSDKQTYYKLTLSGGDPDSVREMAETLFSGQCVDGDIALCEAALSARCFLKLVELGVPFPHNRYGEYIGYKTDHDPRRRATSIGPYTSKKMTECLEESVKRKGVPFLNQLQVIRIVTKNGRVCGMICLDTSADDGKEADRMVAVCCKNIIFATGGPAGMYANSVYPVSQYGATGLALEAGASGKNLTEWQYGLASVSPRWNVSGTYMQVLPRIYSVNEDGSDEHEFLMDFFQTAEEMLSKLFLKGYQWPFDVRKVDGGSSIIDILVYLESCKGRRVYLDYRKNPVGGEFFYENMDAEAREYLMRAGACFGTPIERLAHMNQPAIDFYRDKGIDLEKEPLEIALCAQHNNGGLDIDCHWQTGVKGLFAVGEAAASHGVYRPGGTALNAGQVGSTRAAEYIAARCKGDAPDHGEERSALAEALAELNSIASACYGEESNVRSLWKEAAKRMSAAGAAIREKSAITEALNAVKELRSDFTGTVKIAKKYELGQLFRLRDMLISQEVYLSAMLNYIEAGGKSRGSALYTDQKGVKPYPQLPNAFTFVVDDGSRRNLVQEACCRDGEVQFTWREVRPIPEDDDFFENVWRSFRENGNID